MRHVERAKITEGFAARQTAFVLLNHVFIKRRTLEDALNVEKEMVAALSANDTAFVKLMVSVVLKRMTEIDALLQPFLPEGAEDLKPASLINIFRIAVAQYVFLDIPAYTVINTAVDVVEEEGIVHHKNMVGEVLRRLTQEHLSRLSEYEAAKINTPAWLWKEWVKDYKEDVATQIAEANFDDAPLDISVKYGADGWAKQLGAKVLVTGSLRKEVDDFIPGTESTSEASDWWVQGAASAVPVKFFGDLKGKTVVDLCAAPGGKTAQLALTGAKVIAVERSAKNMAQLQESIQRLQLENVTTVVADGTVWQPKEKVDAVLLDAPCTETGTLRYRPDLLALTSKQGQEQVVHTQQRLIENAAKMLKREGIMVYCNASLQKAEGERQLDWVQDHNLPLKLFPIRVDEVPGIENMITSRGEFRSLPFQWEDIGGIDGSYAVRFLKV